MTEEGGKNESITEHVPERNIDQHVAWLKRKFPGTTLAFNYTKNVYRLYLMIDLATEFFVEAFLYPSVVEDRFVNFRATVRKLIDDAREQMTEALKEEGLQAQNKHSIN